jgi:WD40-like Beta Propeller Repeat
MRIPRCLPALGLGLSILVAGRASAQAVAQLEVLPPTVMLQVGQRQGVVATAYDAHGQVLPTVKITFSSRNVQIARAEVDTRQPGVATIVGVAAGVTTVEAVAGGKTSGVQVQVGGATAPVPAGAVPVAAPAVTSNATALRLQPNSVFLLPSEDVRLAVAFLQADGSPAVPLPVSWRSLNSMVASVAPDGDVVGVSVGQGVIEARTATGLVARSVVQVAAAPLAFGASVLSLSPGQQDTVPVTVPSQGNRRIATKWFTWTSANPAIATVTPLGVALGLSAGRTEFTATGFGQTANLPVVVHRGVAEMRVHPPEGPITVPLGGATEVGADAYAADGTTVPEAPFSWRVADTTVATYDAGAKLLHGRKMGHTELQATGPVAGLAATWPVDVVAGGVALHPARFGLAPGGRRTLAASFVNTAGQDLGAAIGLHYRSLDPETATTDEQGNVQGIAYGHARIVGTTSWGKSDTADVFVQGEVLVSSTRRNGVPTLFAFDRAAPTRLVPLTQDSTASQTDAAYDPDGDRIAYVSDRGGNAEIYVMNADGSDATRLTQTAATEAAPAWTPDGTRIVYASNAAGAGTGTFHLWIMNANGTDQRQLTEGPQSDFQPAVSPDGRTVAFTTDRGGNYDVYLMDLDGANQRQFTRAPAPETTPGWLADGRLTYLLQQPERNTANSQVMRADVATGESVPIAADGLAISDFDISGAGDLMVLAVTRFDRGGSVSQKLYLQPLNAPGAAPEEVPAAGKKDRLTSPAFRK